MKKYILTLKDCITSDGEFSQFDNLVYELNRRGDQYCHAIVLNLITHPDGQSFYKKGDPISINNKHNTKDVTNVYNKILRLKKKMVKYENKLKSQIHINDVPRGIDVIKKNFENGKYPTKTEFKWMNYIWKLIKQSI